MDTSRFSSSTKLSSSSQHLMLKKWTQTMYMSQSQHKRLLLVIDLQDKFAIMKKKIMLVSYSLNLFFFFLQSNSVTAVPWTSNRCYVIPKWHQSNSSFIHPKWHPRTGRSAFVDLLPPVYHVLHCHHRELWPYVPHLLWRSPTQTYVHFPSPSLLHRCAHVHQYSSQHPLHIVVQPQGDWL